MLDESIQASRSLTYEISPPTLHSLGFEGALEWLADQMQERHGFAVRIDKTTPIELHNEAMAGFLFSAVRELLFNSVKHSGASEARVELGRENGNKWIRVCDNGKGFDAQRLVRGFGVSSIKERLSLFNGSLDIESAPDKGACFTIKF